MQGVVIHRAPRQFERARGLTGSGPGPGHADAAHRARGGRIEVLLERVVQERDRQFVVVHALKQLRQDSNQPATLVGWRRRQPGALT